MRVGVICLGFSRDISNLLGTSFVAISTTKQAVCTNIDFEKLKMKTKDEQLEATQVQASAPAAIRHSSLPKLARCACYESNPVAGPAAARGTLLDGCFRELLSTGEMPRVEGLGEEDIQAVQWAAWTLRSMACGEEILSLDEHCRVETPGMEHIGTADAIVPGLLMSADLKTGQIRNYREQMAAYALGLMEMHFAGCWTCELLFCDQRQVVTHQFTYEEASEIVNGLLMRAVDPDRKPELCEYCGWCVKSQTCEARTEAAAQALEITTLGTLDGQGALARNDFEGLLEDPERLGRFLSSCKVLDDFRDRAETRARELLEAGGDSVPGWKLRKGGPVELVFPDDLARLVAAGNLSLGGVLEAQGTLGAKKFRELWAKEMAGSLVPEEMVRRTGVRRASLVQA